MESDNQKKKTALLSRGASPYLVLAAAFLLLHIFYNPIVNGFILDNMRLFLLFAVFSVAGVGLYLYSIKCLTITRAAALIIAAGVLIRITYVLYTGIYTRQHDVGDMTGFGHWGYIMHFTKRWSLPETNNYQFYHPPLHHFLAAVWYRINEHFHMDVNRNLESVQYLTAFYSSCFMVVAYRIFKRLKLTGIYLLSATAIIAFHPTFFILAGSINNDMLAILLYAAAVLWLMKWYEAPTIKHTVGLALCVGAGMMTKMNVATLAFVIAPLFLAKLLERGPRLAKISISAKTMLFGLISIPLGMWHSVRNLLVLGQPLGFVPSPGGNLYRGNYTLFERLSPFPPSQVFAKLYAAPYVDRNLSVYTLKSSLFGEYEFGADVSAQAAILIALNFIVILLSLAAMVYVMTRKREEHSAQKWMMFALWTVQITSMVYFYVQFPYGCTMDFRYMVPTLISGSGFIGMALQSLAGSNGGGWWIKTRCWVFALVIGFCVFSAGFYLLC